MTVAPEAVVADVSRNLRMTTSCDQQLIFM